MPARTLRPGVAPESLSPQQKEAVLHAYVFGTGRPPLFSPLDLEKLAIAIDTSGSIQQLAQAHKLHRNGRTNDAVALLKKIGIESGPAKEALKKSLESLSALGKNSVIPK